MNDELVVATLPSLPTQVFPWLGKNLREPALRLVSPAPTFAAAMAAWRDENSAEQLDFRAIFTMTSRHATKRNRVVVHFWSDLHGKKRIPIGETENDPVAARILIGNWRAGRFMTGIRYELHYGRRADEFVGMGRFDQWDLLGNVTAEQLAALRSRGIRPKGNWDFDHLVWQRPCHCGQRVGVNAHIFNIDSAVCSKCGNRPFLSPNIFRLINESSRLDGFDCTTHLIGWLTSVGAQFEEVLENADDVGGARLQGFWQKTLPAMALQPQYASTVRALIEGNTQISFDMFVGCARLLNEAMVGTRHFTEEVRLAAQMVGGVTALARTRQLSSGD